MHANSQVVSQEEEDLNSEVGTKGTFQVEPEKEIRREELKVVSFDGRGWRSGGLNRNP